MIYSSGLLQLTLTFILTYLLIYILPCDCAFYQSTGILFHGQLARVSLYSPFLHTVFSLTFLPRYILSIYNPEYLLLATNKNKLYSQCTEGYRKAHKSPCYCDCNNICSSSSAVFPSHKCRKWRCRCIYWCRIPIVCESIHCFQLWFYEIIL